MRVTGGRLAGRILQVPRGPRIRSTQDQVRQALFNLLGDRVEGARALDLFCGSGAVGIEALSRGAAHVTFVDRSGFCIEAVRKNLASFYAAPSARYPLRGPIQVARETPLAYTLIRADAAATIERLGRAGEKYDWVFLDPPYGRDLATKSLNALEACAIVSPSGWVIVEQDKRDPLPHPVPGTVKVPGTGFSLQRTERYGDTALVIYARQ